MTSYSTFLVFGRYLAIHWGHACSLVTGLPPQKTHVRPVGSEPVNAKADQPTPEALAQARRHTKLAEAHERKVVTLEEVATYADAKGDHELAAEHRREADQERDAARDEWDRAAAIQGPTQFTEPKKGDPVEIPIPSREAFLRDLEKVAPPAPRAE